MEIDMIARSLIVQQKLSNLEKYLYKLSSTEISEKDVEDFKQKAWEDEEKRSRENRSKIFLFICDHLGMINSVLCFIILILVSIFGDSNKASFAVLMICVILFLSFSHKMFSKDKITPRGWEIVPFDKKMFDEYRNLPYGRDYGDGWTSEVVITNLYKHSFKLTVEKMGNYRVLYLEDEEAGKIHYLDCWKI